jgi:hypothetical protein
MLRTSTEFGKDREPGRVLYCFSRLFIPAKIRNRTPLRGAMVQIVTDNCVYCELLRLRLRSLVAYLLPTEIASPARSTI